MRLKQVKHIMWGLCGAVALSFIPLALTNSPVILVLDIVLMSAGIGFNLLKWRCPHCGEHLGRDGGQYCRHCGTKLDDNDLV